MYCSRAMGQAKLDDFPLGVRATLKIQYYWSRHQVPLCQACGAVREESSDCFLPPILNLSFLMKWPQQQIEGYSLWVSSIQKLEHLFIGARSVGEKWKLTLPLYSHLPATQILNTLGICLLETSSHLTFVHFYFLWFNGKD